MRTHPGRTDSHRTAFLADWQEGRDRRENALSSQYGLLSLTALE